MKKLIFFLLNVCIGINIVFADDYTGLCGENLYWQYYPSDGVLEIKGYGPMTQYDDEYDVPWHSYMSAVSVIKLPQGLTSISAYAFEGGYSVREVSIPQSVKSIGEESFAVCRDLFNLDVPNGVKYIGKDAFQFVPNISYHGSAYGSPWGASCVNGYIYENIIYRSASKTSLVKCNNSFSGRVIVPSETTIIEEDAFSNCTLVTEIFVPSTVLNIHEKAFNCCFALTRIEVDEQNPNYCSVDGVLFNKDKTILKLYPPNKSGITYNIPHSVITLGTAAFSECKNIQTITIPEEVRFIHDECFLGCTALKSITFTSGLLAIRDYAFMACKAIENIQLPESLQEIGEGAFMNCSSLIKINIPSKVNAIKPYTFNRCENLQNIYTGDHVEEIGESAFSECRNLEVIKTSNYLSIIGKRAFHWCDKIKTIYFGTGLREIEAYAFDGQVNSCTIYCKSYKPPYADETAFFLWKSWVKVFVPQSSVSDYKYTSPWSHFDVRASN